MAVAVESSHPMRERHKEPLPGGLKIREFEMQTAELIRHTIHTLLFEQGVRINGFSNGVMAEPKFSSEETKRAFLALKGACKQFMKLNAREITEKASLIAVSDSMLCVTFHETMYSIFDDDINWGRIVALFCFSTQIALKACEEQKYKTIESIEGWMTTFVIDKLKDWILRHRGWGGLPSKFNDDKISEDIPVGKNGSSWLTLAAVGLGAVALTAILGR